MTDEIYRLTLEHFIRYGEDSHQIELPLVVQMSVDELHAPTAIGLNQMLDIMRDMITEDPQLNSRDLKEEKNDSSIKC